jgi:hypothetical protein
MENTNPAQPFERGPDGAPPGEVMSLTARRSDRHQRTPAYSREQDPVNAASIEVPEEANREGSAADRSMSVADEPTSRLPRITPRPVPWPLRARITPSQAGSPSSRARIAPTQAGTSPRLSSLADWAQRRRGKWPAQWRLWLVLVVSLIALAVGILDFALIVGAVPVPVPGLRAPGELASIDTATYSFERSTDGWLARGAAANAVASDAQAFAGRDSLEFQVTNLSAATKAFAYISLPPPARPNTRIVAHLYVPAGGPTLLATIYALDRSWAWHNGQFFALSPGQWTATTYQIPAQTHAPIRELGVMILGTKGYPPYSGPLYLDSVDLQNR